MPDLVIRDVPQEELDALAARGLRHGRTDEEEARHLIHEAAAEETLLAQLERASRAVDRLKTAEPPPGAVKTAPRRRYQRSEPTPRRS